MEKENEKKYSLEETLRIVGISENTLNKYILIYYDLLDIKDDFDLRFSELQIFRLIKINELLQKPSYEKLKFTLLNKNYLNAIEKTFNLSDKEKTKKIHIDFDRLSTLVGLSLATYSFIRQEIISNLNNKELNEVKDLLNKLKHELIEYKHNENYGDLSLRISTIGIFFLNKYLYNPSTVHGPIAYPSPIRNNSKFDLLFSIWKDDTGKELGIIAYQSNLKKVFSYKKNIEDVTNLYKIPLISHLYFKFSDIPISFLLKSSYDQFWQIKIVKFNREIQYLTLNFNFVSQTY